LGLFRPEEGEFLCISCFVYYWINIVKLYQLSTHTPHYPC
jgi:hypothetical protein